MFAEVMPMLHGQMRAGAAGVYGLDFPACLTVLSAQGVNPQISAIFLPFWEAGLLEAEAEKRDNPTEDAG